MSRYANLIGRIYATCGSKTAFARKMGISCPTLASRLNGESEWKQSEIQKATAILEIPRAAIYTYFFTD